MNEALSISNQVREMAGAAGVDAGAVIVEMAVGESWDRATGAYDYLTDSVDSVDIVDSIIAAGHEARLGVIQNATNEPDEFPDTFVVWLAFECGFDEVDSAENYLDQNVESIDDLDGLPEYISLLANRAVCIAVDKATGAAIAPHAE